jgi:hypothetical protein
MTGEGRRLPVTVIIGTSGWQYRDWRGLFYPPKLPQRLWLEHYQEFYATVESNNAFYRLPERATFEKWRERTPPGGRLTDGQPSTVGRVVGLPGDWPNATWLEVGHRQHERARPRGLLGCGLGV